ncbi:cysteine-rich CWC family protein [Halalkalibacter wakoensis]|uniref:cysteine-rich CWC family protein n=1 Tax=Halalkalibacter wakoensis TaxID=127891 RepID=UPI0009DEFBD1|nr:cysteine-rich CWC family protein [Halalkalibacter wakoensis]
MENEQNDTKKCPICKGNNECSLPSCWCLNESFPQEIFSLIPSDQRKKSCICKQCLTRFMREK